MRCGRARTGLGWAGAGHRLPTLPIAHIHSSLPCSFAEVLGVECPSVSTLELSLTREQLVLHSARAQAIKALVELFLNELKKASMV